MLNPLISGVWLMFSLLLFVYTKIKILNILNNVNITFTGLKVQSLTRVKTELKVLECAGVH